MSDKLINSGPEPVALGSAVLAQLPPSRRPHPSTVCEVCPAALWYATAAVPQPPPKMAVPAELKCYCTVLQMISWQTFQPVPITHCDGMLKALGGG